LLVAETICRMELARFKRNGKKNKEFGKRKGAHGGVWECPFISLKIEGTDEEGMGSLIRY